MTKTYINIAGDVRDAASLEMPVSRVFRDAWAFEGEAVVVDMPVAKEIHKVVLRAERKPLLEALDVEFMKALETGGDAAAVTAKKEVLRNVTSDLRIVAAETPEALEALALEVLTGV